MAIQLLPFSLQVLNAFSNGNTLHFRLEFKRDLWNSSIIIYFGWEAAPPCSELTISLVIRSISSGLTISSWGN